MTPTARSLTLLRKSGYFCQAVESWIPYANKRRDLFGCIDILAIRMGCPVLAIQATTAANVAARLNKARVQPPLRTWLACGCEFEVWGWFLAGERWQVRRAGLRGDDLASVEVVHKGKRRRKRPEPDLFAGVAMET